MPKTPCLDCGTPAQGSRCTTCRLNRTRQRDQRRGTAHQRGLGADHQRQRQRLLDQAGPITHCPRCGRAISKDNPITGEHGVPRVHGGTEVTDLICLRCNSSLGGRTRRRDH